MVSILQKFFCLTFCFTAFSVLTPAAQNPPVMPAPVSPAQNVTPTPPTQVLPTPALPVATPTPTSPTQVLPTPVPPAQNVTPTPPAQVLPTPALPVAAPAPTPVAPATSAATPAVTSASLASSSNYEKEFDDLYQNLNQVASIKKELKKQLNEIEEKLDLARKVAIESKETSFKVIQQSKTPDAEALVAQVNKNLQSLLETQKKLNDIDLPKFEDGAKKIQEVMQVIQTKMNELESKGLKLQISQAQLELQKKNALAPGTVSEKGVATQSTTTQPQKETTFSQKVYQFATDSIASGISMTKRGWKSFRNWVYSKPEEAPVEVKKNSKSVDLGSESAIKNVINELDGILKQFDEIQISMLQKYTNIKSKAKNLEIRLKSNDDIRRYFERLDEENPTWKEATVSAFSSALDGIYVICKATKKAAHMVYDKFFKGFVHDVKDKIHEQEKQEHEQQQEKSLFKQLEGQGNDPYSTTPVMQIPAVK